jgi:hypothetical protein
VEEPRESRVAKTERRRIEMPGGYPEDNQVTVVQRGERGENGHSGGAGTAEVVWAYPPREAPLGKREPVRMAGAVATLVSAGALALYGWEITTEQQDMIRELVLLAIPIVAPMIAGFEVARSKVDSPATVERKMKEARNR